MGAPANDNFANATPLPASGSGWYNNLNSSAESGEPTNFGHTVWFSLTFNQPGGVQATALFVDTRQPDLSTPGYQSPYLNTTVRLFSGSAVNSLTELSYLVAGNTQYGQNSSSLGSYVVVLPPATGTIYIRVDGVPEGWFLLKWGSSNGPYYLGKCGNCSNNIGISTTCVGTFQGPDLTKGDLKNQTTALGGVNCCAFAVSRATISLPAGIYMLRYCTGYYEGMDGQGNFTIFSTMGMSDWQPQIGFAGLFRDNTGATLKFSPLLSVGSAAFGEGPLPGDALITTPPAYADDAVLQYYDGSAFQFPDSGIGSLQATSYNSIFLLAIAQTCNSVVFTHAGGQMNWMMAIPLGDFEGQLAIILGSLPEYDAPLSPYMPTVNGQAVLRIGPAGVPSFALMRINPRIVLVSANLTFDNSPDNNTPNGQKNAVLTIVFNNPDTYLWAAIITPTGFFIAEDANYYSNPGPPPVSGPLPQGNTTFAYEFLMIANGNVGQFTLALSDANGDTFLTSTDGQNFAAQPFTITITPLFSKFTALQFGSFSIPINGKHVFRYTISITNSGNATTISAGIIISATVAGQPIQISGNQGGTAPPFGNTFTYQPFFGVTDPVLNPTGPGLAWEPPNAVTFTLYVPVVVGQAQTVVLTAVVKDGTNSFAGGTATINVPAG